MCDNIFKLKRRSGKKPAEHLTGGYRWLKLKSATESQSKDTVSQV